MIAAVAGHAAAMKLAHGSPARNRRSADHPANDLASTGIQLKAQRFDRAAMSFI
jgi:hypothetical protein